jgi:hypothetical protein
MNYLFKKIMAHKATNPIISLFNIHFHKIYLLKTKKKNKKTILALLLFSLKNIILIFSGEVFFAALLSAASKRERVSFAALYVQ